jgi:maleate cis-trans isomerase
MQPQPASLPREELDSRHLVHHAGVLVPWANSVVEAELPQWAGTSVVWHYARLVPPSARTALDEDFLAGLLAAVPAALGQLAALSLQDVYLACTSAAFMFPSQATIAAASARVPVVTAFDAILAALRQWHADRIVLLTPYPETVCDTEADTFTDHGITVTGHATLNLRDGYSAIEPSQVRELAGQVSPEALEEAQAIVLSCTGWPTIGLGKALTRELGTRVLSSNQAIAMHALQAGAGEGR